MDIASARSVRGTSQRYQMQVHDRYITSPRQVHHRLSQIESLTEHREPLADMTPPARAASRSASSVARTAPCQSPPGGGRRALGHRLWGSVDGMAPPIRQPAPPQVRTRPARRPARAERWRTGPHGCAECTSQASSPGARIKGQNGRGSAKRAVIRTASFARTLYTICTCTLPCIDP